MEREHNEINIRVATVEDAQQILQIYAPYRKNGNYIRI